MCVIMSHSAEDWNRKKAIYILENIINIMCYTSLIHLLRPHSPYIFNYFKPVELTLTTDGPDNPSEDVGSEKKSQVSEDSVEP